MNDLISIIIPVYNLEKYIERCLDSVLNQTHTNIEVIVVNDGSTDHSASIIDNYTLKDTRIKVLHKKNSGVSDTRNKGMELAQGDYMGFVDGDDEILPNMFERLLNNLKKYNADISHCGFEYITDNDVIPFHGTGNLLIQSKNEALQALLEGKIFEPSTCTKLFSKKVITGVQYPIDIKINEDLLFNVYAFNKAQTVVFEDVCLYKYYQITNNEKKEKIENRFEDTINIAAIINDFFANSTIEKTANNLYVGKILNVAKQFTIEGKLKTKAGKSILSKLKNSSNFGLKWRTKLVKSLLLYFPSVFLYLNYLYQNTLGKKNKW